MPPSRRRSASERSPAGCLLTRPVGRWVGATVLAGVFAFVGWIAFSVRIGGVFSDSMSPTLMRGDKYVIRIDAYRHSSPRRGDIVVIRHPEGKELLVKRVIGIPGDLVAVQFGRVRVNGAWLEEPYLRDVLGVREQPVVVEVPPGRVFLLGDNRNFSEDSRDLGSLPIKNILGRVTAIILPLARRGTIPRVDLHAPAPQG